jgi:hypothetical protein
VCQRSLHFLLASGSLQTARHLQHLVLLLLLLFLSFILFSVDGLVSTPIVFLLSYNFIETAAVVLCF